jgi:hypothetical protein
VEFCIVNLLIFFRSTCIKITSNYQRNHTSHKSFLLKLNRWLDKSCNNYYDWSSSSSSSSKLKLISESWPLQVISSLTILCHYPPNLFLVLRNVLCVIFLNNLHCICICFDGADITAQCTVTFSDLLCSPEF